MASQEYEAFYARLLQATPPEEQTIGELRESTQRMMAGFGPDPDTRIEPFQIGQIPAFWVFAPHATKHHVILFLHGGGFNAGSVHTHLDLMGRISKATQCYVLGIDYRLAPEHPFPAALDDCLYTYRWLVKNSCQAHRVAVIGASCGGGLALSLFLTLKLSGDPLPAAGVCLSPWVDLALESGSLDTNRDKDIVRKSRLRRAVEMYIRDQNPKNPLISPLHGDLRNLPPLLLQVGSRELLLDEVKALAEQIRHAGGNVVLEIWEDMIHCWQLYASRIPEGQDAIQRIASYVTQLLAASNGAYKNHSAPTL